MAPMLRRPAFRFARPEQSWPFRKKERAIRIEESIEDDMYRVRAELPGFDPKKDIHVTTDRDTLTISATRESHTKRNGRSEFRYGSFTRSRTLPAGADTNNINAQYTHGVLEVTMPRRSTHDSAEIPITKH
ncbi:Hsp20/alpha crystallin family protein [Haloechinothrix salitolerans]|uniref:Hsp20/alpha crystallin family protein n=1 Tax=Haloechinothrix salitolerans TaxID=926830 RepID=A0ABW2C418_9PSEU